MAKDAKCSCNPVWMLVAVILFTLGLYALVGGFAGQFNQNWPLQNVLGFYFVGFLLFSFGKMAKWKCSGTCEAHMGKK